MSSSEILFVAFCVSQRETQSWKQILLFHKIWDRKFLYMTPNLLCVFIIIIIIIISSSSSSSSSSSNPNLIFYKRHNLI
jgi:hypothetical protein